jgi:hypothetical protein
VTELVEGGGSDISRALVTDFESCSPDMTVEELFPLATASPFPIAVLDEKGVLVGYIRNQTIIESMIQDETKNKGVNEDV